MLVLEGTVVTMRDGAPPADGRVFIGDDGLIHAVTPLDPEPAGFADAPRVATRGVIYPGLIDLHSHLLYNTLPLWTEPTRAEPWRSHSAWPRAKSYGAAVSAPAGILGLGAGRALLRYVEARAIAGGVTAIQGDPKGGKPRDGELVRNVDSEAFGTDRDFVRVRTIVASDADQLETYVTALGQGKSFIYHVCEGSDPKILEEYELLEATGLVQRRLVAIHGGALRRQELDRLAAAGATLVWSPFSNLWLYGSTAAIGEAVEAGVRLCLGSDWGPSGTRSVLWELKVADLWNRAQPEPVFDDEALCRLVTANPGDALSMAWPTPVGRLEPGRAADVAVFARRQDDPYANLIRATERDVRLVVVGGRPRYGTTALLKAAGAVGATSLTVAGQRRSIDLGEPGVTWRSVLDELEAVRRDPKGAVDRAQDALAAWGSDDLTHPEAPFVLLPDMPSPNGDVPGAGPIPPEDVKIPPLEPLATDAAWLDAVDANPFHGRLLSGLRGYL